MDTLGLEVALMMYSNLNHGYQQRIHKSRRVQVQAKGKCQNKKTSKGIHIILWNTLQSEDAPSPLHVPWRLSPQLNLVRNPVG